ncbi:transposase [Persephonella sp.]
MLWVFLNTLIDRLIVDGTGFGYDDTYRLSWERGKRLKEVKSHVKTEVLVAVVNGTTFPIAVEVGRPYSDERKLFREILRKTDLKARGYIIGDRLYGMDSQLAKELVEAEGLIPVIPVREGIRKKVRDKYRKRLMELYEENRDIYKERYRVEQLIGKVKNAYGDRDNTKSYELACVFVLMRFLLYNTALLLALFILLLRFFKQAYTNF